MEDLICLLATVRTLKENILHCMAVCSTPYWGNIIYFSFTFFTQSIQKIHLIGVYRMQILFTNLGSEENYPHSRPYWCKCAQWHCDFFIINSFDHRLLENYYDIMEWWHLSYKYLSYKIWLLFHNGRTLLWNLLQITVSQWLLHENRKLSTQ